MVDENFDVHLLEVNPGPDFKQTGGRLRNVIVQLWEQVSCLILDNDRRRFEGETRTNDLDTVPDMTLVYSKEWSVSKISNGGGMTLR